MGFTGIHKLIMSIFKINTIPEQFGMKNQENTYDILKNLIIRPIKITLLSYRSKHKGSEKLHNWQDSLELHFMETGSLPKR